MNTSRNPAVMRFGPFEVEPKACQLRKHGIRVKPQAQPFEVLIALLERPGFVVTPDELRRRLWPDGTFVDFEHGLNAAVTRLRQAPGDSAEQRRHIETLPRRGYRFIANIDGQHIEVGEVPSSSPVAAAKPRRALWTGGAAILALAGVGVAYLASNKAPPAWHPIPLTSFPGYEANPFISPDGHHVAFTWNGEKRTTSIFTSCRFRPEPRTV